MFKLIVLSALVAVAAARPGLLASTSLETVGSIVRTIPTAISHSSQTQVHSSPIVTPVVSPVIRTIAAPTIVKSVAPVIAAAPTSILTTGLAAAPASILAAEGSILSAGAPLLRSDLGLGLGLGLGLKLH